MGNSHSQLDKIEADFRSHDSIQKIQVLNKKSWLSAVDVAISYANSRETIVEARFLHRPSKDNWITLVKSPTTIGREGILASDVFSTVRFSDRKRPIQLSIGGRELVLAARDSFAARKAYSHKCITKDDTWFTWSKHSSSWFCFAGDLLDIEGQKPIVRISPSSWSVKRLMDIEMTSEMMEDDNLMLEILVVGIGIVAKETVAQEVVIGSACSIM